MSKKVRTCVVQFVNPAHGKTQEVAIQRPQQGDDGPAAWNTVGFNIYPVRTPEGNDLLALVSTYLRKEVSHQPPVSDEDDED